MSARDLSSWTDTRAERTRPLLSLHKVRHESLTGSAVLRRHQTLHVAGPGVRIGDDETGRRGESAGDDDCDSRHVSTTGELERGETEDGPSLIESESSRLRYAERGSKVVLRAASSSLASESSSSSPNLSPFLATSARELRQPPSTSQKRGRRTLELEPFVRPNRASEHLVHRLPKVEQDRKSVV